MKVKQLITLTSCSKSSKPLENKIFCFDTMVNIKLYESNESKVEELGAIFKTISKLTDNYIASDLTSVYTLNQTNEEVTVDKDLYNLLKLSLDVKNEGATHFNPLCGSLSKKWKESLKNQQILDEITKNAELLKISTSSLLLKDNNVVQRLGDAEIDLGGIAKGYALDKTYEYLESNGIKQYLIDAGSSSILLGEKNNDDGLFSVGLKEVPNTYIKLKNCFVSSSGLSQQGVTIDGITYSHIINPVNGSAINENDAVIVISDTGYYGDALSTSMMMNTIDEIKEIESAHNVKTIVVKNGQIVYSHKDIEVYKR